MSKYPAIIRFDGIVGNDVQIPIVEQTVQVTVDIAAIIDVPATIAFQSLHEFCMLHSKQLLSKWELGILPPFTMCFPLQKAVRLLLGLSTIYRWRYLGRSRLTAPYSVSILRYPVGRYPVYRRCVNGPVYLQSQLLAIFIIDNQYGFIIQPVIDPNGQKGWKNIEQYNEERKYLMPYSNILIESLKQLRIFYEKHFS